MQLDYFDPLAPDRVQEAWPQNLVRAAVLEVAQLPDRDLVLVVQFVRELKQRRGSATPRPSVAEVRAEARRLASAMESLSREQVLARFRETLEYMRAQAVAEGTAIEGDWQGD